MEEQQLLLWELAILVMSVNKIKYMKKGFTLIELLVVIAIIGILASIVMISMSGASNQAKDARIQGDLTQVRSIAELIKNDDGDYDTLCSANDIATSDDNYGTQLSVIKADMVSQGGTAYNCLAEASGDEYCVAYLLNSGIYYCIDSDGRATTTASMGSNCTGTDYDCG